MSSKPRRPLSASDPRSVDYSKEFVFLGHDTHYTAKNLAIDVILWSKVILQSKQNKFDCRGIFCRYGESYNSFFKKGFDPSWMLCELIQNVLPQWFELGLLDPPENNPWSSLDLDSVYESHISLAEKAAVDSMILLKNSNDNKLHLPLPNGNIANNTIKFAVVGPCADNIICYQGDYNAEPLNYSTILAI